jgi:hypothetical protein
MDFLMVILAARGDEEVELHRVDKLLLTETIATLLETLRIEHWRRGLWDRVSGIEDTQVALVNTSTVLN